MQRLSAWAASLSLKASQPICQRESWALTLSASRLTRSFPLRPFKAAQWAVSHRIGALGLMSLLVWFLLVIAGPRVSTANWLIAKSSLEFAIFAPIVISLVFGVLLLAGIRYLAKYIIEIGLLLTYVGFPLFSSLTADAQPQISFIPLGYFYGLSALYWAPRWMQMRSIKDKRFEQAGWFALPCLSVIALGIQRPEDVTYFDVCSLGLIASSIAGVVYYHFKSMAGYLVALRHKGDAGAWRSTHIMLSCVWLWPIFALDPNGRLVTGEPVIL